MRYVLFFLVIPGLQPAVAQAEAPRYQEVARAFMSSYNQEYMPVKEDFIKNVE